MSAEAIDFGKGYSAKFYLSVVDIGTWGDLDRIKITGGTINRATDDLMDSADINVVNYTEQNEQLVRVWMDTKQGTELGHTPLFTGWASSPGRDINGVYVTNTLQCYSVLKPAQDILLPPGWYAPLGTDSKELIKELLKPTKAPIIFDQNGELPTLKEALIAEENENNLSMAELILYATGWMMQLLGDGRIYISQKPDTDKSLDRYVVGEFDTRRNDVVEKTIKVSFDWYSCPNVFRAIVDDQYSVARDDDPDSPFSTVSRGREIWAQESSCDLNENESIAEYAVRRLKELQTVYTTVEYDRRFQPDINPRDLIRLDLPAQDIRGIFQIASQTITLGYNAKTSEEVIQITYE